MRLTTYDEFLIYLCDAFDELVAPVKLRRTNRNVIYLMLKAVAKGLELLNSVCYALSGKFDPRYCTDEDLVSVAELVGTRRRGGSGSGLYVTAENMSLYTSKVLPAGNYWYDASAELRFSFQVPGDVTIPPSGTVSYVAMSNAIGAYPVTAISDLPVQSDRTVPEEFRFSCIDNASLMGVPEEPLKDFRERLLKGTSRQNAMIRLEEDIRSKPYIFDARVIYNNTGNTVVTGGVTIPNAYMAIFISGEARNELAELVAEHIICPTVSTGSSLALHYYSPFFYTGQYDVNVIPFTPVTYNVTISYMADTLYVDIQRFREELERQLKAHFNVPVHRDIITESEFYDYIASLNITAVRIIGIQLSSGGIDRQYIDVDAAYLAQLNVVSWDGPGATT